MEAPSWMQEVLEKKQRKSKDLATTPSSIHTNSTIGHSHATNNSTPTKANTQTRDVVSGSKIDEPAVSCAPAAQSRGSIRETKDSYAQLPNTFELLSKKYAQIASNQTYRLKSAPREASGRNSGKMVAAEEIICEQSMQPFDSDDASEELKYGPGIVSKLRCRYLSLALRQSTNKQRPSINNLRRTTSLNNLLDEELEEENELEDAKELIHQENQKNLQNSVSYSNGKNGNEHVESYRNSRSNEKQESRPKSRGDSLKRARSVEAILRYDNRAWERDVQKERKEHFENHAEPVIMIEEITPAKNGHQVTIEDKIQNGKSHGDPKPKRLSSLIDEYERPPADVVKQTMRIFEASANRKRNVVTRPIGQEVAAKVASFKKQLSQEKPPIVLPKPLSPKKPNVRPRTTSPKPINITNPSSVVLTSHVVNNNIASMNCNNNNLEKYAKFAQEKPLLPKLDINIIKNNLETNSVSNVNNLKSNGVSAPQPPTTPERKKNRTPSPEFGYRQNGSEFSSSGSTPNILSPTRNSLSPALDLNGTPSYKKLAISQPQPLESPSIAFLTSKLNNTHLTESQQPVQPIVQTALPDLVRLEVTDDKDYSIAIKPLPVANNSVVICELDGPEKPTQIMASDNVKERMKERAPLPPSSNINQNSNVTPVKSASLTAREIEKNIINRERSEEPIVSKMVTSTPATAAPKWTAKKKSWQDTDNNTMVFNFSDRKDVPDYIEHDGLILRRKRELPKANESGYVVLGDLTLETSTDPDDGYQMGPPSPCDVEFENANVIIDGKSSIRSRMKDVKFKIQFDDSLTATFEYPSENSMMIDDDDDDVDGKYFGRNQSSSPQSKLLNSVPLGTAPFANYTPSKASSANFELGVSRTTPSPSATSLDSNESNEAPPTMNGDANSLDQYLKPASGDEVVHYSEETRATDLLF